MQAPQPTVRKLRGDMQMEGKARLLGNAASGHSTMGLKHIHWHPLALIQPCFLPPQTIQEDRRDKCQALELILLVQSCRIDVFHDARPVSGSVRAAATHNELA